VENVKTLIKTLIKKILHVIIWLVISMVFFIVAGGILSVLVFFLLLTIGAYPMGFIGFETARVFILVLIVLVYFVVFILEGAIIGLFLGIYMEIKHTLMKIKIITTIYNKIMKKLFKMKKENGYISTDDFPRHKGKERISFKQTIGHMYVMIDEVLTSDAGGLFGLMASPIKFVTLKITHFLLKKVGRFMLTRMSEKDKSGDRVIFLDVLDYAVNKGIWGFITKYLITPLFLFTLASFGIFILIILLPVGILNLLNWIF
jgi:hypothetical protein